MLINREGRFKARPVDQGVDETGPNKLATFMARFRIEQEYRDNDWYDVTAENAEITGYFYLEKRDGALNTVAIDSLKAALGWDGRDLFWLQDTDLSDRLVQITVVMETYDNKTRPKVKWISHESAEPAPSVTRAADTTRWAIANRLGPKLRANAGGVPRPAPAPSAPAPTSPRAATSPRDATSPRAATTATSMNEAWAAFNAACPPDLPAADRERQWFRALAELCPNKDLAKLTPEEWGIIAEKAPAWIVPF